MHIQFPGKITAVSANLVQGAASITIGAKMDEIDDDTLDRLAELCSFEAGVMCHLEANNRQPVDKSCWITSVKGDYTSKLIKVVLRLSRPDLAQADESVLVEICRMNWDVSVEVSNRQMTIGDWTAAITKAGEAVRNAHRSDDDDHPSV
jgi:hypothetical protein